MTEGGNIDDIGIVGMDADTGNGLGVLQAHVFPGFAAVDGSINAVTLHDISAELGLSRADIYDVGIGCGDRDCAYRRAGNLSVSNRFPGQSAIRGFPQSAAYGAEIVFHFSLGTACDAYRTAAAVGSDVTPAEVTEYCRIGVLGKGGCCQC